MDAYLRDEDEHQWKSEIWRTLVTDVEAQI